MSTHWQWSLCILFALWASAVNSYDFIVECGGSVTVSGVTSERVQIEFENTKTQNVLFTNCQTEWWNYSGDTTMYLLDTDGNAIQSESVNTCEECVDCIDNDWDNCNDMDFYTDINCPWDTSETFVTMDLAPGLYTLELVLTDNQHGDVEVVDVVFDAICYPDFWLCAEYNYTMIYNGTSPYHCEYHSDGIEHFKYQFCNDLYRTLNYDVTHQIVAAYEFVDLLGLGIQNNILLLSLLFVNVTTALFVIFGLNQQPLDGQNKTITTVIVLTQLLLISSFPLLSETQFGLCFLNIDSFINVEHAPSPFHFAACILCAVLVTFWAHFSWSCTRKCCFCDVLVFLLVLIISILLTFMGRTVWWTKFFCFVTLQTFLPLTLCYLSPRCQSAFNSKGCLCKNVVLWITLLVAVICTTIALVIVHFVLFPFTDYAYDSCLARGILLFFSPMFVGCNLFLMFTKYRVLVLFYFLIMGSTAAFVVVDVVGLLCKEIVNISYITHSFFIPMYIVLFFRLIPTLKPWSTSLFGMYLVAFDVFSDFVVVFFFIAENEPIFAFLQISFIITGQIVGAVSDVFGEHNDELSAIDKVMALTGFGRIWFTVKWWNETLTVDGNGKYKVLRQKHKIWDLMYESFPTVALQIYASMTTDVPTSALVISIMFSAVSVTVSSIRYLNSLLEVTTPTAPTANGGQSQTGLEDGGSDSAQNREAAPSLSSKISMAPDQVPVGGPKRSIPLYLMLFVFMISDFYIRSIPTVMFLAAVTYGLIGESVFLRFIFGLFLFGAIAIFEFVANQKMRIPSHRGTAFIFKIFAASMFSSFYTILCTLSVLKLDPFYAESVIFSKYLVEHCIRCGAAVIFCIFYLALTESIHWGLMVLFIFFVAINAVTMYRIHESEFVSITAPDDVEMIKMKSLSLESKSKTAVLC